MTIAASMVSFVFFKEVFFAHFDLTITAPPKNETLSQKQRIIDTKKFTFPDIHRAATMFKIVLLFILFAVFTVTGGDAYSITKSPCEFPPHFASLSRHIEGNIRVKLLGMGTWPADLSFLSKKCSNRTSIIRV